MKAKYLVTKPAAVFSGFTIVSRILGLVRDMLAASIFGASMFWDAFVVAFTFPNLFRRIFGEGALGASFVPVFTEYMHKHGKEQAWKVANIVITLLTVILIVLSIVTIGLLTIGRLYLPISPRIDLVLKLSQIMFPYVIFICIVGLFMGILNAFHRLSIPAIAPAVFNLVLIAAIWGFRGTNNETEVCVLAFMVLVGGITELLIHIPVLKQAGMHFRPDFTWSHPGVRRIFILMGPMVLGFGVTQINIVIDRILALWLGPGCTSTLYYGNRLVQLPLGVFGIAIALASLSVMSKQAARKDMAGFKDTLTYGLRIGFFIGLPASAGLIVFRYPLIRIIFQRGAFNALTTVSCSRVLLCYSVGLFAYLGLKIVTQGFYALQDSKTPVKIAAVMVFLNLILNLILMVPFKEAGLALATAICAVINVSVLMVLLYRRLGGGVYIRNLWQSLVRSMAAAVVMGTGCWFLIAIMPAVSRNALALGMAVILGMVFYILISLALGGKEAKEIITNLRYGKN